MTAQIRRSGPAPPASRGAEDDATLIRASQLEPERFAGLIRRHAPVRPWLYGIATNLIGRHRRSEIRQYRALARTGTDPVTDPVTEPFTDRVDSMVSADGVSRQLAAALAKLPAGHRDTLLLVAWGDLTYEQAALALAVPVGTVRSRLSRARSTLRRALGDADPSGLRDEPGHPPAHHEGTSHE